MVGLDTNVLVRYLTRDDESQWQQAKEVIESGQPCFVANIVLCELVWVLRGNPYKFGREEILSVLEMMLQSPDARVREPFCSLSSIAESEAGKSRFFRLSNWRDRDSCRLSRNSNLRSQTQGRKRF